MQTDRDRLIEIIDNFNENESAIGLVFYFTEEESELFADYLLANGVIVPPCKVGDKTYLLLEKTSGGYDIVESQCVYISENKYSRAYSMDIDCAEVGNTLEFYLNDFGKWVFLTKEEAEEKLKELGNGNKL